jgi:hypothetical protein
VATSEQRIVGARSPHPDELLGVPYETAIGWRERLADDYSIDFGQDRVFPELLEALVAEVSGDVSILEVGAATGLLTRPLLECTVSVTALEPSEGMLRRLVSTEVADSTKLRTIQGLVEDLPPEVSYDIAVVTFTPRHGQALVRLLMELAIRVSKRIVMLLDDRTLDWAYLARSASARGFDVRLRVVGDARGESRAVILVAGVDTWEPRFILEDGWGSDSNAVDVPHPAPRGSATRLVRFFMSGGDRALSINIEAEGVERLYGNLRTAVHRLAREEVTVRRQGDVIQLVRVPRSADGEAPADQTAPTPDVL